MVNIQLADISPYLTSSIVDNAFHLKIGCSDPIQNITITRATPSGEGLISVLYRIHVSSKYYKANFIVKAMAKNKLLRRSLNCKSFFKREVIFFTTILPALAHIQNSHNAKENIQNCIPFCYSCYSDGENDFIILEDLSERGLQSTVQTTRDKCYLALKTLAHFHSVSFALKQRSRNTYNKLIIEIYENYYVEDNKTWYSPLLRKSIEIDKEALLNFEDAMSSAYYHKFLEITTGDIYDDLIKSTKTISEKSCIVHGDSWLPNLMMSNDEAVLIDFQMLRCASPAMDLTFFILLNAILCESKETFKDAVNIYHESLKYYLKDMQVDVDSFLTIEDLWKEIKLHGKFCFLQAVTTIPLSSNSELCDNLADFENKDNQLGRIPLEVLWKLLPLKNKDHQLRLVKALRIAVDLEILDAI